MSAADWGRSVRTGRANDSRRRYRSLADRDGRVCANGGGGHLLRATSGMPP